MAVTRLRLGVSLTSIRRRFGDTDTDAGFRILTQGEDSIITQNDGLFLVLESAPVSGTFTSTADTLLTQDGKGIELEHVTNGLLVLNHDAESAGTELITQDGEILVSQDNEVILTQKVR